MEGNVLAFQKMANGSFDLCNHHKLTKVGVLKIPEEDLVMNNKQKVKNDTEEVDVGPIDKRTV